ncbi:MAG: hypothetical protein AAFR71_16775 [Pseudomonadota bacterium]
MAEAQISLMPGVAVSGNFASLNDRHLTVSLLIANNTQKYLQILIVEPEPVAVDNRGNDYRFSNISGLNYCGKAASGCLLGRGYYGAHNHIVPIESFSMISPNGTAILNYKFKLNKNSSNNPTIVSISSVAGARLIDDILEDEILSDEQRRRQFQTVSIGTPSLPLSTE